jgi:hypothetical protein
LAYIENSSLGRTACDHQIFSLNWRRNAKEQLECSMYILESRQWEEEHNFLIGLPNPKAV